MTSPPDALDAILELASLGDRPSSAAIHYLGKATDGACSSGRVDILRHLGALVNTIDRAAASPLDTTNLDYYLANIWNGIRILSRSGSGDWGGWEEPEMEGEVVCLRRALESPGLFEQSVERVCQIQTNLGNCYSAMGRAVEAISTWDKALLIEPRFGMARGNRAVGFWTYARRLYDKGHSLVLARTAWEELNPSRLEALEEGAGEHFSKVRRGIEDAIPDKLLQQPSDLDGFDLGRTGEEQRYRLWCLDRRLFLNPLNEIGSVRIAATDVLTCPSIVAKINEGPRFHDFFNQIKQEYCSARWLVYEANQQQVVAHFSDHDVLLYNTLDYPSYGLSTEKLKLAFRALYSLFDKIAYFLNAYLELDIPEKQVSFRTLWYCKQKRAKGLRPEFIARGNPFFRGLHWLSKDLYEDRAGFREAMNPMAERLNEIRNHLEHKYLKLHSDLWAGPEWDSFKDGLAVSLSRDDFEEMTGRLLALTRSAIIYLSLGVHTEERSRATIRGPDAIVPPMPLDTWQDDWKV